MLQTPGTNYRHGTLDGLAGKLTYAEVIAIITCQAVFGLKQPLNNCSDATGIRITQQSNNCIFQFIVDLIIKV